MEAKKTTICEVCGGSASIRVVDVQNDRAAEVSALREHWYCVAHTPVEWTVEQKRRKTPSNADRTQAARLAIARLMVSNIDPERRAKKIAFWEKRIEDVTAGRYKPPTAAEMIQETAQTIERIKNQDMDHDKRSRVLATLERFVEDVKAGRVSL